MSRLTDSIPKGSVFWIKWELEDLQGNKFNPPQYHYYKAEATGKKRNNMFQVRYDDGTEQYYSTRGVNTRTKNILTEDAYNDGNIITIGEKQPRVGDEFQAVVDASPNGPGIPMSKFAQNALNLVPLTNKEIEQQDASTELPAEVQKDMEKAGMSKKGYGGGKRRKKKTRKRKSRKKRKSRRKKRKTNKRKMRKNKKTRKRKQKGRGANICKMISDPDKKNELKVMALSRAKRARRLRLALHPETKQPLATLLSMLEAHNYCQEMNNDNYRCDPGSGMCEKMDSEEVKNVINGMLSGRGFK